MPLRRVFAIRSLAALPLLMLSLGGCSELRSVAPPRTAVSAEESGSTATEPTDGSSAEDTQTTTGDD